MKKSEKDTLKVSSEELIEMLDSINTEGGFPIPQPVVFSTNKRLRDNIKRLIEISPNDAYRDDILSALHYLESNVNDLKAHVTSFSYVTNQFYKCTEGVLNQCKDSFAIALVTLKLFKLDSLT